MEQTLIETQQKLDALLREVKRTALHGSDPGQAVLQLLGAAKDLITQAQAISEGATEAIINRPLRGTCNADPAMGFAAPAKRQRVAQNLYDARRIRDRVFDDPTLFGEPAWDLLLDLLSAERLNKRVSISSACIAASVPQTTALRWINVLEDRGLVERVEDELDARRVFLHLTKRAHHLMKEYFITLAQRNLV